MTTYRPALTAPTRSRVPVDWPRLLRDKRAIGLTLARTFADSTWWVYLFWIPPFLAQTHGVDLHQMGFVGWIPYFLASIGNVFWRLLFGFPGPPPRLGSDAGPYHDHVVRCQRRPRPQLLRLNHPRELLPICSLNAADRCSNRTGKPLNLGSQCAPKNLAEYEPDFRYLTSTMGSAKQAKKT